MTSSYDQAEAQLEAAERRHQREEARKPSPPTEELDITCQGCGRKPEEINEYSADMTGECGMTPTEYVQAEEGTYNRHTGHFTCTDCYIKMGMPTSPTGWITP